MSVSTQPYKGARDFYPEDKQLQKYIFGVMRKVSESYGYLEYDAPILEPTDLFLIKGSDEIVNEQTYTFTDRGDRSVTIRTEMTPSVSRMVAGRRQELSYPARWYSIPNLWRYERPQRGRLREFWQLNVDIFGVAGIEADHEIICVADSIMKSYGAKPNMFEIRVNSRALMQLIMTEYLELEQVQITALMRLIDRMHKMPIQEFFAQADLLLSPSQRELNIGQKLASILTVTKLEDLPQEISTRTEAIQLKRLIELLHKSKVASAKFDISLMRGFDYYTDIVFEVFDKDPDNNRSLFGGGRYDGLVAMFGVEPVPTVGFGMGDVTIQNFLESHKLMPKLRSEVDAVAILIDDNSYELAQPFFRELREEGIKLAIDSSGRKIDKQLKSAIKLGVRYVIFVGPSELEQNRFKLKDISDGTEHEHSIERIIAILAAQH